MEDIDWDLIIEDILNERCIIVLGPGIYKAEIKTNSATPPKKVSLYDEFIDSLELSTDHRIKNYYLKDNLFEFSSYRSRIQFIKSQREFFNGYMDEVLNDETLNQLVDLPFLCYINAGLDSFLFELFKKRKNQHHFEFYPNLICNQVLINGIPLIYNLLGNLEDTSSPIITHDSLFSFFNKTLGNRSSEEPAAGKNQIPPQLLKYCEKASRIIFLGVELEKWYVQLIFRILGFNVGEKTAHALLEAEIDSDTLRICESQFFIVVVRNKKIDQFVVDLWRNFKEREKGDEKLRPRISHLPDNIDEIKGNIKELLSLRKIKEAIEIAIKYLHSFNFNQKYSQVKTLEVEYNNLLDKKIRSKLTTDQLVTKENSISKRLMIILDTN